MSVSPFKTLENHLEAAAADGGVISLWWGDLEGARFARGADVPHYAASTMKLPLAIAAMRKAVRGELDLSKPVKVHNSFTSVADGSTFSVDPAEDDDPGTWAALDHGTRTILQLADHAIAHSGNLATNLLLELVGFEEVARVLDGAGCSPHTVVRRGMEDLAARDAGIINTVTAADLGLLMSAVGRRDTAVGGPMVCAPVEAMLARQRHRNQIPAGLPAGLPIANKSGWIPGVSHDVCLVRPLDRAPFVLAICTTTELHEEPAAALVASLARDVWRIFAG